MNKEQFNKLCDNEYLPVFYQPWWLDLVYGSDKWEIIAAYKGDNLLAIMPVSVRRKFKFSFMMMPSYTPYQGPWLFIQEGATTQKRYSDENKALEQIVKQIPAVSRFQMNFHFKVLNGLSFYWQGYNLEFGYTYLLKYSSDNQTIFKAFKPNLKRDIKSAEKSLRIVYNSESDIRKAVEMTYSRQSKEIPDFDKMKQIVETGIRRGCGRVYSAYDEKDNLHASIFIVWDNKTAYYLLSGGHPKFRKSGATSLLIWKAIIDVSEHVEAFDFEGSMVQPIEYFFRGFGAERIPYLRVHKYNSKIIKLKHCLFK